VDSAAAGTSSSCDGGAEPAKSGSAATGNTGQQQGGLTVSLHPLVVMNISEHWTRTKAQEGKATQVYGALIGQQRGREIEIMNSFELDYTVVEQKVVIDRDYYNLKEGQFKQVFSQMDFLGWYSTGETPTDEEVAVHRQICEINESPLFLQLNPAARGASATELPVALFESVIDLVGGEARMLFVPLAFTLATEEAERIGLDHVAKISGSGGGGEDNDTTSKVAEHLSAQHSAIKMLTSRVRIILEYVKAVEAGELPSNHDVLREAKALASRLPLVVRDSAEGSGFGDEFDAQMADGTLLAYLGAVMKSCSNLSQFVGKFNVLYQRQGPGRRMRGLFF